MPKILVVDDAPMFRDLGMLFLSRSGKVLTAEDGVEGLEIARRERPDVAVVDFHMPRLSGDGLCDRIKSDPQLDTLVIVLTDGECPEDRERAIRAGADDVLAKPIDRMTLVDAVRRLLRPPSASGMRRVPVDTPVRIRSEAIPVAPAGNAERWGTARNLSRGGVFIEANPPIDPETELEIEFRIPGTGFAVHSTAKVVWQRLAAADADTSPVGMGLRFLALDRTSTDFLDEYVAQWSPPRNRVEATG